MLSVARSGPIANLDTDLAPHAEEVIVSLDILPDAYAFVTNGVAAGSPAYQRNPVDVSRESLDAWVASEGAAGRVVTALSASPTAGLIRAYSHARDGDSTSYETAVVDASSATLIDSATTLGADGYIITGFGRVGDDGTVLVGTRPPGAAARTVSVQMVRPDPPDLQAGDAIVAWIFQDPEDIMILQR
jgi:hypothetical protein